MLFLSELCTVLDLARPDPQTSDPARDGYVFEKSVPLAHGAPGRIDLYKRGCFVLEARQGSDAPEDKPGFANKPGFSKKPGLCIRVPDIHLR